MTNSIDFICHNFLIILKTYPFHYLTTYTALHYTKKEELVVSLEKSYTQRVYAQQLCTISIRRFPSPARAHHFHLYSFSYFFLKKNYTIFYKFCTRPRQKPWCYFEYFVEIHLRFLRVLAGEWYEKWNEKLIFLLIFSTVLLFRIVLLGCVYRKRESSVGWRWTLEQTNG